MANNFTRGDELNFAFKIKQGSTYITYDECSEIEFQINTSKSFNDIRKLKSKNEISFDSETNVFSVLLTQADTFRCEYGANKIQIRIIKEGNVSATLIGTIFVGESLSNKILNLTDSNDILQAPPLLMASNNKDNENTIEYAMSHIPNDISDDKKSKINFFYNELVNALEKENLL